MCPSCPTEYEYDADKMRCHRNCTYLNITMNKLSLWKHEQLVNCNVNMQPLFGKNLERANMRFSALCWTYLIHKEAQTVYYYHNYYKEHI